MTLAQESSILVVNLQNGTGLSIKKAKGREVFP
jgi:hypothetical protein